MENLNSIVYTSETPMPNGDQYDPSDSHLDAMYYYMENSEQAPDSTDEDR